MVASLFANNLVRLIMLIGLLGAFAYLESSSPASLREDTSAEVDKTTSTEKVVDLQEDGSSLSPLQADVTSFPTAPQKRALIEQFIYPNGTVVLDKEDSMAIETKDDPTTITQWYTTHNKDLSMNMTSSVQTNTNGTVQNKIAASNENFSVEIEISRPNGSNMTKIAAKIL